MMFRQFDRSPTLIAVLLTAIVVSWFGGSTVAQDDARETLVTEQPVDKAVESSDAKTDSSSNADSESSTSADPALRMIDEQERARVAARRSAMVGLLVLSLICIVFLVLIIVVALWARRIRMLTRQPLPEQRPGDPLWYLRKGKGSDSSDIAKLADGGSVHGES